MAEPITVDNGGLTDYAVLVDDVTDATLGTGAKQIVALADGTIGSTTKVAAGGGVEANALRVTVASDSTGVLSVDDNGSTLSVDDGGGSITVDGAVTVSGTASVDTELTTADLDTGAGTDTRAVVGLVKAASGGGVLVSDANPLPISDGGGSLTVDGTVTVTEPVSVDDNGGSLTVDGSVSLAAAIPAGTNNIGDVDVLTLPGGLTGVAEDSASANGEVGLPVLGVRNDSAAARIGTDADYGMLALDSAGRMGIADLGGAISVDDNGSSLTVDGTVTVQDGGGSLTVDGTVTTTPSGDHTVIGKAADGAAVSGNPVLIAGQDGTNVQSLKTDASGELQVDVLTLPALVAGTANIGDVDVLTVPAPLSTSGGGTEATALRVTVASDSTGVLSVDDNGATISVDDGAGSLTVDGTVTANAGTGTFTTKETRSATGTTTQVADTATSTTILASNANRLGCSIQNDSSAVLYIKCGTTASATDYTARLVQYAYWEAPYGFTGRIDGIWATDPGDGAARVTEWT